MNMTTRSNANRMATASRRGGVFCFLVALAALVSLSQVATANAASVAAASADSLAAETTPREGACNVTETTSPQQIEKETNNDNSHHHHRTSTASTSLQHHQSLHFSSPPRLTPEPGKTILFVAHFFVSTDVNQMLLMANELRSRGHQCHFIVMEPYMKRVQQHGFSVTPTPNILQGEDFDVIQRAFRYESYQTSFVQYIYKYILGVVPLVAKYYEPSVIIVKDWIRTHGPPDLMVCSKASDSAMDVAWHADIPMAVLFTMPLGGLANNYEDVIAAPDSNLWGAVADQAYLWPRLRKLLARVLSFGNPVSMHAAAKIAMARLRHGFNPLALPGMHWGKSVIISPWSMGIDLARPLRPLTFLVGFLTPANDMQEQQLVIEESMKITTNGDMNDNGLQKLSKDDREHLEFLNDKSDGVVFCAFGSLAVLTQEWFDELVQGMDLWARVQGPNAGGVIAVNELSLKAGLQVDKVPPTVQVTGWINQKLFLAHPHTQAFITHGGLGSLGEAIEARVPMLVFPLFFDQPNNAHRLTEAGVALKLHFREEPVTAAKVAAKLKRLSSDPSFQSNLIRQYQIHRRSGGVVKAVDILEEVLLYEGNMSHLIPVTERVGLCARTNLDLLALLCFVLYGLYCVVVHLYTSWQADRKEQDRLRTLQMDRQLVANRKSQ